MIILGIDPGTAITGYSILKTKKQNLGSGDLKPKVIDFGCITTEKNSCAGERLKIIYKEINKLIKKHQPNTISVESLYFFKNLKTAIPVSQARGVILLAAAHNGIPVKEFTPLQVKMAIVGFGRADKNQVQKMAAQHLDISSFDFKIKGRAKDDAFDALGIALCACLDIKLPWMDGIVAECLSTARGIDKKRRKNIIGTRFLKGLDLN